MITFFQHGVGGMLYTIVRAISEGTFNRNVLWKGNYRAIGLRSVIDFRIALLVSKALHKIVDKLCAKL